MTTKKIRSQAQLFLFATIGVVVGMIVNAVGPALVYSIFYSPMLAETLFPELGYMILAIFVGYSVYQWINDYGPSATTIKIGSFQAEIDQALQRVQNEPEKAKPAWDLARAKLEQYFDRNLSQINYIFWLSVIVMVVGFGFILYGISQALIPIPYETSVDVQKTNPQSNGITPAIVGSIAGIITEFIGATFLFIYRSTIEQALTYTKTLERINSVGMAMQILDTISNESKDLQDSTKAEIVKMVLSQAGGLYHDNISVEQKTG